MKANIQTKHNNVTWKFTRTYINKYRLNHYYSKHNRPSFSKEVILNGIEDALRKIIEDNRVLFITHTHIHFHHLFNYELVGQELHIYWWNKGDLYASYKIE